jgi:hypothetical protein
MAGISLAPDLLRLVFQQALLPVKDHPDLCCCPSELPQSPEAYDGLFRLSLGPMERQVHVPTWRAVSRVSKTWRGIALGFIRSACIRLHLSPRDGLAILSKEWVEAAMGNLPLLTQLQSLTVEFCIPPAIVEEDVQLRCSSRVHRHFWPAEDPRYLSSNPQSSTWGLSSVASRRGDELDAPEGCSSGLSAPLLAALVSTAECPALLRLRQLAASLSRIASLELLWPEWSMDYQLTSDDSAALQMLLRAFADTGRLRALRVELIGLQPLLPSKARAPQLQHVLSWETHLFRSCSGRLWRAHPVYKYSS